MGEYQQLTAAIQQAIKTNGTQEITGAVLQQTLVQIVQSIGGNATFAGVATPSTNPGSPDQSVFWLAFTPGTYTNFRNATVAQAAVFTNSGGSWVKTDLDFSAIIGANLAQETGDSTTTAMSQKAVTDLTNQIADNILSAAISSGGVIRNEDIPYIDGYYIDENANFVKFDAEPFTCFKIYIPGFDGGYVDIKGTPLDTYTAKCGFVLDDGTIQLFSKSDGNKIEIPSKVKFLFVSIQTEREPGHYVNVYSESYNSISKRVSDIEGYYMFLSLSEQEDSGVTSGTFTDQGFINWLSTITEYSTWKRSSKLEIPAGKQVFSLGLYGYSLSNNTDKVPAIIFYDNNDSVVGYYLFSDVDRTAIEGGITKIQGTIPKGAKSYIIQSYYPERKDNFLIFGKAFDKGAYEDLKHNYKTLQVGLTNDYGLAQDGGTFKFGTWKSSDIIDIPENAASIIFAANGFHASQDGAAVQFFDENGNFLEAVMYPNGDEGVRNITSAIPPFAKQYRIASSGAPNNVVIIRFDTFYGTEGAGTGLSQVISQLKSQNYIYGKSILAVGDSMVQGHTLSDSAGQTWLAKIALRNGMTRYNRGTNGAYMSNHEYAGTVDNSVYQKVCVPESSQYIPDSIMGNMDYILIYAGTNDCNADITIGEVDSTIPEEFCGALNAICTALQTRAPKAHIGFITPMLRAGIEDRCWNFIEAIKNVCKKYSIPVYDQGANCGINWSSIAIKDALTLNDTYHLNEEGNEWISYKYEAFIREI